MSETTEVETVSTRRMVENRKRKISEYNLVRIVGTGTFGKVYFATLDGKSYAIKFMQKKKVLELDQLEHINNEKNILASVKHPFIVNLVESFSDVDHIYLVFDFV